jgi:hypothetical protein
MVGMGYSCFLIPRLAPDEMADLSSFNLLEDCQTGRLISVGQRRFSPPEALYLPHDREGLAIQWSLSETRSIIFMFNSVILQTDSKTALSKFTNPQIPNEAERTASTSRGRRWLRWIADLADVLPLVRWTHLEGSNNNLADYLSRRCMDDLCFVDSSTQTDDAVPSTSLGGGGSILSLLTSSMPNVEDSQTPELVSALSETLALSATSETVAENFSTSHFALSLLRSDAPEIGRLMTQWNNDDSSLYIKDLKLQWIYLFLLGESIPEITPKKLRKLREVCERRFSVYNFGFGNALLFHNNDNPAVVVPDIKMSSGISLRNFIIRHYHEDSPFAAHRGEGSTLSYLRRFVWFPRMDAAVSHWVSSCVPCTIVKSQRVSNARNPRSISYVNQHIVADWCGPLPKSKDGYRFCLIIVDAFSGFTYALPYRDRTAERCVDGILSYSALFGYPDTFSSDNDPSFIGSVTSSLRDVLKIAGEVVSTYSPWSSGSAEEAVKKVKQALAVFSQRDDID